MEVKPMEKTINDSITLLAGKITKDIKSEDALRFSQAALNLVHVLSVKSNIEGYKKPV
jgi:hypothetical protein